ncbi:MAG: DUF1501 domain-containing protein [Planctomycetota bacterium]
MSTSRRGFLLGGIQVSALMPFLPEFALGNGGPTSGGSATSERVLVVVQLTGGNDGLNTVVPFSQDAYYRQRPFLGQARGGLHELDDDHGLHASMSGLGELFAEGRLAVVHGVGNPNPDRSHFRSLEVWHTADPDGPAGQVGWLGRLSDQIAASGQGNMPALAVGQGNLPLSMRGRDVQPPMVRDPRGFRMDPAADRVARGRAALIAGEAGGDLGFLRLAARTTYDTAARMAAIADGEESVDYPAYDLAKQLRLVSQLVRGGFGTRIFHLSLDGFDTHSRQAPVHAEKLRQVSGALTAFQRDLEANGIEDRVVTMVFSEFGRRTAENASRGTDHGRGAPLFLLGTRVRGGLHGTPPDLASLVDGDLPNTTDFRAVYTLLERDWMGLEASTQVPAMDLLA